MREIGIGTQGLWSLPATFSSAIPPWDRERCCPCSRPLLLVAGSSAGCPTLAPGLGARPPRRPGSPSSHPQGWSPFSGGDWPVCGALRGSARPLPQRPASLSHAAAGPTVPLRGGGGPLPLLMGLSAWPSPDLGECAFGSQGLLGLTTPPPPSSVSWTVAGRAHQPRFGCRRRSCGLG